MAETDIIPPGAQSSTIMYNSSSVQLTNGMQYYVTLAAVNGGCPEQTASFVSTPILVDSTPPEPVIRRPSPAPVRPPSAPWTARVHPPAIPGPPPCSPPVRPPGRPLPGPFRRLPEGVGTGPLRAGRRRPHQDRGSGL